MPLTYRRKACMFDCDTAEVDGGGGWDEGEAAGEDVLPGGVPAIGCGGTGN